MCGGKKMLHEITSQFVFHDILPKTQHNTKTNVLSHPVVETAKKTVTSMGTYIYQPLHCA